MMFPRFSVIIPVLHEEAAINPALEHVRSLREAGDSEIIVVDGDPAGGTINCIQNITPVRTAPSPKGRGIQMNTGAALAQSNILIFLHVDTRLPFRALTLIDATLRESTCVAGAFDLAIASPRPIFRLIEKTASLRSRITSIPYGDQAFFFRRDYFESIGGFAGIPIMEDVEIMRRIKKREDRIVIIDQPATTSARRWEKEGVFFCTLRNWFLISLYLSGISPERLSRFYR